MRKCNYMATSETTLQDHMSRSHPKVSNTFLNGMAYSSGSVSYWFEGKENT